MSCQLPADCLTEIFEYLEQDKVSLYSCLLVNRLWCEISVRILWRDIWSFNNTVSPQYKQDLSLQIISTLVACLSNESKDLLHKNGIFNSTPTWKLPLFNYASFCKVLSIHKIDQMIQQFLEKRQFINSQSLIYCKHLLLSQEILKMSNSQSLNYNKHLLLSQEILRMFMNQISSLKSLEYLKHIKKVENIMFPYFPGARNCLTDLTELTCSSNIQSEFFYRLSQICRNIQSLAIEFGIVISNGLTNLISSQNNLKSVTLISYYIDKDETGVITSSLTKISSTLIKLKINHSSIPLSFISKFKNLQELILSSNCRDSFDDFSTLQYVTFSQLKVLKFLYATQKVGILIKFLEINGKNLKEFYVGDSDNSLYLAVAKFCPNLQTLSAIPFENEIDTLKMILNSCQYLESITVWCDYKYLNENEILEVIAKHSPKNFYELKLDYFSNKSRLLSRNLETFLISWNNRIPQRSLSLIIIKDFDNLNVMNDENMKLIEKYKKLGIIKKFKIQNYSPE